MSERGQLPSTRTSFNTPEEGCLLFCIAKRVLCVFVLFLVIALAFTFPVRGQQIPIIGYGPTYDYCDATAGGADDSMYPLTQASYSVTFREAHTLVNCALCTLPSVITAWVAKTVQISQSGQYRFTWWGHQSAVASACALGSATVWFYERVVDASTNTLMKDWMSGYYASALCIPHGGNTDFSAYVDVTIGSDRINHQFYIEVYAKSYGDGVGLGTSIADALWNGHGITYWHVRIEPTPWVPPPPPCVAKDTPILTDAGYVPVQKLKVGDTLMGYDVANRTLVPVQLLSISSMKAGNLIDINDGTLQVTFTDQPIYIKNETFTGWLRDARNLTVHDSIFDPVHNSWIKVDLLTTTKMGITVYDIKVDGPKDFIANDLLLLDKV